MLCNTINTILEPSASVCLESNIKYYKQILIQLMISALQIIPTKLDLGVVAAPFKMIVTSCDVICTILGSVKSFCMLFVFFSLSCAVALNRS